MALRSATLRDSEVKAFPGFLQARDAASWPDRRRGTSNFLTWSFFLAEILAAELFLGKGAKAAEDLGPASTRDQSGSVPTDDVSGLPGVRSAEEPEVVPATRLLDVASASAHAAGGGNAAAAPVAATGSSASSGVDGSAGGGGDGSGAGSGAHGEASDDAQSGAVVSAGDGAELGDLLNELDASVALDLGLELLPLDFSLELNGPLPGLNLSLNLDAPLIDLSLDGGLLSGLDLELDVTLSDVGSLVDGVVGELASLTGLSLLGGGALADADSGLLPGLLDQGEALSASLEVIGGTAGQLSSLLFHAGAASSDGSLGFAVAAGAAGENSLFEGGRYTDYNLALNSGEGGGEPGLARDADGLLAAIGQGGASELLTPADGLLDHALGDQDLLRGISI